MQHPTWTWWRGRHRRWERVLGIQLFDQRWGGVGKGSGLLCSVVAAGLCARAGVQAMVRPKSAATTKYT